MGLTNPWLWLKDHRLRSAQNIEKQQRINVRYVDSMAKPYAAFDFKYRSMRR